MKKINLLDPAIKLSEKRKITYSIPAAIIVIAIILMIVFNFTLGSPVVLGTDFTGGYAMDIQLGTRLTDDTLEDYQNRITEIFSNVTAEDGVTYNVSIDSFQRQVTEDNPDTATIRVKYFSVADEDTMSEYVNVALRAALEDGVLKSVPTLSVEGNKLTLTYTEVITDFVVQTIKSEVVAFAASHDGFTVNLDEISINPENNKQVIINATEYNSTFNDDFITATSLSDVYNGFVREGSSVGATVSSQLILNAVIAISLALVFMLCYIGVRFQLSSALACIIALFHDLILTFCFMAMFRIEINSTFIAALITILGYSINNSIIIFDRIRENMKSIYTVKMTPEEVADLSIKETLMRTINTTITTMIMIAMIAIIGVADIKIFALPIIFGLLFGTYSSMFIAPSLWALFQRFGGNKENFSALKNTGSRKKSVKENA